ncbi:type IV pilin protein [Pseudoduganella buxea]|uniref:Prepilin-type N-terminal cleavage/methylation domain-containing protein n=1 Tax=Pseudoduganella buxea TaxID=1949069 RepID=A0A6I3T2J8_9BURK|nr:type IV pilin protein [Pseudoduganella buxea]MTV55773.1 prepilin-type N-terminal cleavage/methylation domain-containing protein [Pseudoduganella buxea]GGC21800.1 hypothetical protein GCM10011572_49080 [Pseudoduganella buxea]
MRRTQNPEALQREGTGLSLVELLIALAVAGIIAAAAYPDFGQHVVRQRRTEAQGALQQLMQQQERYYTLHNRYVAFGAEAADADARLFRWYSGASAGRSAYEIAGRACDNDTIERCVQLVATPGTRRVDTQFRDSECEQLILTSTGERRATGPGRRCWR